MNYPSEFSWKTKDNKKIYAKDWKVEAAKQLSA